MVPIVIFWQNQATDYEYHLCYFKEIVDVMSGAREFSIYRGLGLNDFNPLSTNILEEKTCLHLA